MTPTITPTSPVTDTCPHCGAEWAESLLDSFESGPMEGDWIVTPCSGCNAFTLEPLDGGDGLANVLAALEAAGCNPEPVPDPCPRNPFLAGRRGRRAYAAEV